MEVLGEFVSNKEETSLDIAVLVLIKAIDPFLNMRKKIDPLVNIEAMKQTTLTIVSGDERSPSSYEEGFTQESTTRILVLEAAK